LKQHKKTVDKCVEKSLKMANNTHMSIKGVEMNKVFHAFFSSFQQILARKKYNLCNFAPKYESVDN
jgi:hypothetical protein